MDFYEIIATFGGFILVLAGFPQVIRLYKFKSAHDVSLSMFSLIFLGQSIWLSYGIHLENFPLIVSNLFSLSLSAIIIGLIIKYRYAKG